jgi:serine/threonine-protein kinase RsbW
MQHTATAAPPAPPWEATYPGAPGQVRLVRAALRPLLRGCPLADDVLTLVSELAANAVLHSDSRQPGGTFTVRLQHHPGSHIRAEVHDQGSIWDGDLTRSARPPHGLYFLLTLATRCGIEVGPGSRMAWFRIDYPPPATTTPAPSLPEDTR